MNDVDLGPKSGALLFNSLKDKNSIILAANPRIVLVSGQIDTGFTSFAIDASHLFNFQGGDLRDELADYINFHTKIINHNAC